jgi:DNA-binding Lrp family transcriptional regulator
VTAEEIAEATEIPAATVRKRLSELHEDGRIERVGKGVRNSPHRWRMLSATAQPLVAERNTGGLIEGVGGTGGE